MIDKAAGNPRAMQDLFSHRKIENTVGHLGVDVEEALRIGRSDGSQMTGGPSTGQTASDLS